MRYLLTPMYTFIVLLILLVATLPTHAARPLALESLEPERSLLVMGGSFSPPTEMHLAVMADLLYEQDFPHGVFLVAKPYKAGAAPAEISLGLTRIGVETFDYILRRRNIPFRDFRVLDPGKATWISKAGRPVVLEVSSFDIDHGVTDSIESIRHFSEEVGARNLWWLAGGDSGASMPTWGPWWAEMFDRTNMIFIGRESSKGEASIDHRQHDPLRGLYPDDFLARHRYEHGAGRAHAYRAMDARRPSIFVLGKATLPYSSTLARKSLMTDAQEEAQVMLTPAIYRAIVANTYYDSVRSFLTRENLERYLIDEFRLVEDGRGNIAQYRSFLEALVRDVAHQPRAMAPVASTPPAPALPRLGGTGLSPALADLRNQLVLGDPRFLVSRMQLANGMALTPGSKITLNLVKSQLGFDVPLVERQAVDRRNRWYDLNISTNELRATLGNPTLVRALESASRGVDGALANALATAVQLDPAARLRFEIFTSRRYFNRLALGLVRPEFASELDEAERAFESWAQTEIATLARHLTPKQVGTLGEVLGDLYLVRRHSNREAFWTEFLDLALTEYPGEVSNPFERKTAAKLARRLTMIGEGLRALGDVEFRLVVYRGVELARLSSREIQLSGPLAAYDGKVSSASRARGQADLAVLSGLRRYVADLKHAGLSVDPFALGRAKEESFDFLPLGSARTLPAQNLIRDLHFFYADAARDLAAMHETFESLATKPRAELVATRAATLATIDELKRRLERLEVDWLKRKKAYPFEKIDAEIPGYAGELSEYMRIQGEFGRAIDRCRAINHVALGMVGSLAEAEGLTPTSATTRDTSRELLWREIVGDVLDKYIVSHPNGPLGADRRVVIERLGSLPFEALERMKLEDVLRAAVDDTQLAHQVFTWLHEKYGLMNEVALRPMNRAVEGTYRADPGVHYEMRAPRLHPLFDVRAASSLVDLPAYIHRKWGGLKKIARPDRVVFSELGTEDTLAMLRASGFDEFFQVNSSYAMRGSKTSMAFQPGRVDPLVVFHSFIGEDLFQHKLMQLAVDFGADFERVRVMTSDGLKSWDQAQGVVSAAVRDLPNLPVDDLVLGYGEVVAEMLDRTPHARAVRTAKLGDFAEVTWYDVEGKNGIARHVLVVTRMAYRYFGKSVLPLIQPFLERGVDRVIFAGSAGVLSDRIPRHGVVIPRTFRMLEDDGALSPRLATHNDFYAHAPFGVGFSGRHVSVPSPLVESRERVRDLRDRHNVLSIDVEGARIARLIDVHNAGIPARDVRFASAYIATDVPRADGDAAVAYGLHEPDFAGKAGAKTLYGSLLKLLWDIPTSIRHSAHTSILAQHFVGRIAAAKAAGDEPTLIALARDLRERLHEVRALARRGGRVSRGLGRVYGDLLASIARAGVVPAREPRPARPAVTMRRRERSAGLERVVMLQSLSRSSTLNSGDVVYNRGSVPAERTRVLAAEAAGRAVDWVLAHRDQVLRDEDALELNRTLNAGVLDEKYQSRFARFDYEDESGRSTPSTTLIPEFFAWLAATPPSFETALEAYARYEALHPHKDGSGRTAELIAQHTLLRAGLGPVLLPNRFDVDYILSLKRNGANPSNSGAYLAGLAEATDRFTATLAEVTKARGIVEARFGRANDGLVVDFDDGASIYIQSLYVADPPPRLEREVRRFVRTEDIPRDRPTLRVVRREYDVVYVFGSEPLGCDGILSRSLPPRE